MHEALTTLSHEIWAQVQIHDCCATSGTWRLVAWRWASARVLCWQG